ncbi:MAG: TetR/AcrR family transcriptional regulator [Gemmatimonadota bacterium]
MNGKQATRATRGRPRSFDTDAVLWQVLEAFWARGYEATTVADLEAATGLHKGSLYQAFGGKHALFLAALNAYLDAGLDRLRALLGDATDPVEGVRRWLEMSLSMCESYCARRGCFAVNTVVEVAPHDAVVDAVLARHFAHVESLVADAIARGQRDGSIQSDRSPAELAGFLHTFVSGLVVTGKRELDLQRGREYVDLAMRLLQA